MRFQVGIRRAKLTGKRLKRFLRSRGFDVTHCFCLDLAARLYGYADLRELRRSQDGLEESRWDHMVIAATVTSRRAFQRKILKAAGYTDIADAILDEVQPTECFGLGKTGEWQSPPRLDQDDLHWRRDSR